MRYNALARSMAILNLFLAKRDPLTFDEISSALELPKSTAYKYIAALKGHGLLDYDKKSAKYRLGLKFIEFGSLVKSQIPLDKISLPFMRELSERTKETAFLTIITNNKIYCLEQIEYGDSRLIFSLQRGVYHPLHCGACAKVLLAFLPEKEIDSFLRTATLTRYTENTITDPVKLKENLKEIRESGYAFSDQEVDYGARAIAAPVFDAEGRVIAGLGVGSPAHRMEGEKLEELKRLVIKYAKAVSSELS